MDLDVLIAARTAPNHSWANPVERIMSIVNLGLQCVGMMRQKSSEDYEATISMYNRTIYNILGHFELIRFLYSTFVINCCVSFLRELQEFNKFKKSYQQ